MKCQNGGCPSLDVKPYDLDDTGRRFLCEPCATSLWIVALYHPTPPRPEWVKRAADKRLPGYVIGGTPA